MSELEAENQRLRAKVKQQARELKYLHEQNRVRNLELDMLHYVWCDGGCSDGVHRFHDEPLTQEMVNLAVRNTARLITWWENINYRATYDERYKEILDEWLEHAEKGRVISMSELSLKMPPLPESTQLLTLVQADADVPLVAVRADGVIEVNGEVCTDGEMIRAAILEWAELMRDQSLGAG